LKGADCYELPFAQAVAAAELVDGLAEFRPLAGLPLDDA
jgi:hypothetical protein